MEYKFDIVFMDFNMPIMSGPAATRMIRGNPENPNKDTYIVFLTGSDTEYTKMESVNSGASKVVLKPVSIVDITDILQESRKQN